MVEDKSKCLQPHLHHLPKARIEAINLSAKVTSLPVL
jgi:hypothetical protein